MPVESLRAKIDAFSLPAPKRAAELRTLQLTLVSVPHFKPSGQARVSGNEAAAPACASSAIDASLHALVPFRSAAVDDDLGAMNEVLYVPALAHLPLWRREGGPLVDAAGMQIHHDGYVVVVDRVDVHRGQAALGRLQVFHPAPQGTETTRAFSGGRSRRSWSRATP